LEARTSLLINIIYQRGEIDGTRQNYTLKHINMRSVKNTGQDDGQ